MMHGIAFTLLMGQTAQGSGSWANAVPLVLMMAVIYFLLMRPANKRRQALEEFRSGVKKGDEVITTGGIYGKVIEVSDSMVTLDVGDAKLKVVKNYLLGRPGDALGASQSGAKA